MKYYFTVHAKERFVERTNKKYIHLSSCKNSDGCPDCQRLRQELKNEVRTYSRDINRQLKRATANATEERSFLNNTEFMSRYYERYGYDHRFTFLFKDEIIFVVVDGNVVVTCVRAKGHITKADIRPKYRKKKVAPLDQWTVSSL